MKKRIECTIRGRVQMVMYRDFVLRNARKLGLVGAVWNNADGSVSVVAEGEEAVLIELIDKLKSGSLLSHVDAVETIMKPATNTHTQFVIRFI